MKTVVGLFDTTAQANAAIERMQEAGVDSKEVSVVAREGTDLHHVSDSGAEPSDAGAEGAASGLFSGAGLGILAGLALAGSSVLIPGVGTFLIGGPIVAALAGAGIGAASGSLIGGLVGAGIPHSEAEHFSTGMEHGKTLVTAQVNEVDLEVVRTILDEEGSLRSYVPTG